MHNIASTPNLDLQQKVYEPARRRPLGLPPCRLGFSAGVLLDPVTSHFLKLFAVALVLVGNARLNGVVRVRLDQQVASHVEDGGDLVRRLPLVSAEHAQAHGAFVVVGDVGMIDFGLEGQRRRLEGVVGGEHE